MLETHELVGRSHALMGGDPSSPATAVRSASPVPAAVAPSRWSLRSVAAEAERAAAEAAAADAVDVAAEAAAAAEASVAAAVRRAVGATVPAAVEASVAEAMHAAVAAALQDALPMAVNAAVSAAVREATHLEHTDAHIAHATCHAHLLCIYGACIYQVRETANLQTLRQSLAPRTPPVEPRQKGRPSRGSKERKSHPGREACRPLPMSSATAAEGNALADGAAELVAAPAASRPQPQSNEGYLDDMEA